MNEPIAARAAVLERPVSPDPSTELFPPAIAAPDVAPTPRTSPAPRRVRWPIPAPGVPPRAFPSPARAAAAARLSELAEWPPAAATGSSASTGLDPGLPLAAAGGEELGSGAGSSASTGLDPGLPLAAASGAGPAAAAAVEPAPGPEAPAPSKEERRHLRVVPPRTLSPAQRRRRARALLLAGAGLVVAVAFGLVYLHVILAQRQFALDRLTQKVQTDRTTYERLRVQAAELGSPANIISRAEGQLGMRQPASVTYLTPTVTIGGSAASADPASPAAGRVQAPAGIANWPQIKAQLAGSP